MKYVLLLKAMWSLDMFADKSLQVMHSECEVSWCVLAYDDGSWERVSNIFQGVNGDGKRVAGCHLLKVCTHKFKFQHYKHPLREDSEIL